MSQVKLIDVAEAPPEGGKMRVHLQHPVTFFEYEIGLFHVKGRYFAILDECKSCGTSLAKGALKGLVAYCTGEEHTWNVKTGVCQYDRSQSTPTYRITLQDDAIFLEI